jgi:Ca2+-binding RTX toxin-like protein
MPNYTFQDARNVIANADGALFQSLSNYTGGASNLTYLRDYVKNEVARIYDIDKSLLNEATMFSTTLLRDFIHRAIYENLDSTTYAELRADGVALPAMRTDVAAALRYPASDSCALMGYQLFRVYEALGYDSQQVSAVEGDLTGGVPGQWRQFATGVNFDNSHSTTQVFVKDLGKYVIQDSTFNLLFADRNGVPLSMHELRLHQMRELQNPSASPTYSIVHEDSYRFFQNNGGTLFNGLLPQTQLDYIRNVLLKPWSMQTETWDTSSSPLVATIRQLAPDSDGDRFADRRAAIDALRDARATHSDWQDAADALRDASGYASGFRTYSVDTGRITGEWVTVMWKAGEFVSLDWLSGRVLDGSYDQLVAEASGEGKDRNDVANMSEFFSPVALLGDNGVVYFQHEAEPFETPLNTIAGTSGSNLLRSKPGAADLQEGGRGNDIYYVNDAHDLVWEAAGGGYDKVLASTNYTLAPDTRVERLEVADRASKVSTNLTANKFTEMMVGSAGSNILYGSDRAQKMFGYGGNDTYYVNRRDDIVNEFSGQGRDHVYTTTTYVLSNSSSVENLSVTDFASTKTINLVGNDLANIITGNDGRNQITGRMGNDRLIGLDGNDIYVVGSAGTTIVEAADGGNDTVYALVNYTLNDGAHIEVLRVGSVSVSKTIALTGNGLQSMLVGHEGHNILDPGDHSGALTMYGKGNNDTYYVYQATDLIVETTGVDRVYAVGTDYTLGTGVSIELLATAPNENGAIDLTGNELTQRIVGNDAANILNGKGGNDTLQGEGSGDTFVFDTTLDDSGADSNIDTIVDLQAGTDEIHLSQTVFAGLAAGPLAANVFLFGAGATAATTPDHRIIYDTSTGALRFDSDGDGANPAVQFAVLSNTAALTHDDFVVV